MTEKKRRKKPLGKKAMKKTKGGLSSLSGGSISPTKLKFDMDHTITTF